MAKAVRPRRIVIAASVLSLALAAPLVTVPDAPFLPVAEAATTATTFNQRYTTDNFWEKNEAAIQGLEIEAGDKVEATTNTIFNWRFRNDGGQLILIRPQSAAGFGTGNQDIRVKVTPASGTAFTTTLKVTVVDERPHEDWEDALDQRYEVNFEKSTADKPTGLTLPAGVTVAKKFGTAVGWDVKTDGASVRVTPPANFTDGSTVDIPITVRTSKGTFDSTLKITAKNPKGLNTAPLTGLVDNLGKLLSNNGKGIFEGFINGSITDSGNNNGSPNIVVTNNANPVITNNANATVEIRDNGSNNGNPNVIITNNANPTVEIRDNGSNNGSNNSAVITNNANPVVTGNANNNGSNNSAVITGNANPVVTGNANNNGSNNKVDAKVEPSAVVVKDNASNNTVSGNGVVEPGAVSIKDNGIVQPGAVVAEGSLFGRRGGAGAGTGAGSSSQGVGGLSDPRCVASLVGLGIPLAAMIPVALAQTLNLPALDASAAIAAGAFDQILGQLGVAPSQVAAVGGGIVGVALAATIAAVAITCTPKESSAEVVVGAAPVVPTA